MIGGVLEEFIFAPRLDNLFNVYTAMEVCFSLNWFTGEAGTRVRNWFILLIDQASEEIFHMISLGTGVPLA